MDEGSGPDVLHPSTNIQIKIIGTSTLSSTLEIILQLNLIYPPIHFINLHSPFRVAGAYPVLLWDAGFALGYTITLTLKGQFRDIT